MKNIEKLRAMSDEELTHFFATRSAVGLKTSAKKMILEILVKFALLRSIVLMGIRDLLIGSLRKRRKASEDRTYRC